MYNWSGLLRLYKHLVKKLFKNCTVRRSQKHISVGLNQDRLKNQKCTVL